MRVLVVDISSRLGGVGGGARVAANLLCELRRYGIDTYYLGYKTEYIRQDSKALILGLETKSKLFKDPGEKGALKSLAEAWSIYLNAGGDKGIVEKSVFRGLMESRPIRLLYYSRYSMLNFYTDKIRGFVKKTKPDIVLSNSALDYILLTKMKRDLKGSKFVYIEHANVSGAYKTALDYNILPLTFGTGKYIGLEKARRRFFGFFDGVVALNSEQKESITKYNDDVTVIHSSILIKERRVEPKRLQRLKSRYGIGDGSKVVMYLGRLAEVQKNVSTLIEAFKGIREREFKLVIVGEGKSMPMYQKMAEDDQRIIMTGRIGEAELPYYYSLGQLYVLPSVWESFNATMIEAAHFGEALLLSNKGINNDLKEKFGGRLYTFDPMDAEELRRKIKRYFSDKKLQADLNRLSSDIAKEYSKEKQMGAYARALSRLYKTGRL